MVVVVLKAEATVHVCVVHVWFEGNDNNLDIVDSCNTSDR